MMKKLYRKERLRKRNCLHCKELFLPDYRNRNHQRYCSKPQCRHSSKKASQQKWLSSEKGKGYFQNADNVLRVRQWREAHPGYCKRHKKLAKNALQDVSPPQPTLNQSDTSKLTGDTLQDICSLQLPLLLGVIANLTGNTLQDDIAATTRRFINLGHDILGINPGFKSEGR